MRPANPVKDTSLADSDDRAARRAAESLHEGHYLEILALIRGLDGRVTEIREDAREARDAATRLTERLGAQDMPAKVAELRGIMDKGFSDARSDLVNAITRLTGEMRPELADHDARLSELETFRHRIEGARGAIGWVSKNAPWLVSLAMGFLAALGLKRLS